MGEFKEIVMAFLCAKCVLSLGGRQMLGDRRMTADVSKERM